MKIKGISFWEQHIDRILLGVAGSFFVLFTTWQFVSEPNAVTVGKDRVAPGEIDAMLEERAASLLVHFDENAPALIEIPDPIPMHPGFDEAIDASVGPSLNLHLPAIALDITGRDLGEASGNQPYIVPRIPAPQWPGQYQSFDTLADGVVEEHEELASICCPEAPHDLTWITPVATIDIGGILRSYAVMGARGELPLRESWYRSRVDILDVRIERETLVDGTWTDRILLDPMPGRDSWREALAQRVDVADRDAMLSALDDPAMRDEVIRPPFYPTRNDEWGVLSSVIDEIAWETGEEDEDEDADGAVRKMLDRIRWLDRKIATNRRQQDTLSNHVAQLEEETSSGGGASRSGGGGGGLTGGGSRQGGNSDLLQKQLDRLRERLAELANEIEQFEAERQALLDELAASGASAEELAQVGTDLLTIWGHDLTAAPGGSYRYRFTVEVYNPLFAKKLNLIESQHPLAEQITLVSETSTWSVPHEAISYVRTFIPRAQASGSSPASGSMHLGRITAEMLYYFDGRWRSEQFTLQPGDRLGPTQLQDVLPDRNLVGGGGDWYLLDILADEDLAGEAGLQIVMQRLEDGTILRRRPLDEASSAERLELLDKIRRAEALPALGVAPPGDGPPA